MTKILLALIALVAAAGMSAQESGYRFEAASIKPSAGPASSPPPAPGRYARADTTLGSLIEFAYELPAELVTGGPEWMRSQRIAINARAATPATVPEMRLMMRLLLAERFALKTHMEAREMPVYRLVHSRADRALGPGLRPATPADCAPTGAAPAPRCGAVSSSSSGDLLGRGVTMPQFARLLITMKGMTGVDRVVVDQTGLIGEYMITLQFAYPGERNQISDRPSFFTALQEQAGLKLEPQRAPVELLVIDSAVTPTFD